MSGLIERNLMIYFRNRSGVIFSVLGALISFVLYIIFLRDTMMGNWTQVAQGVQLLDLWLIGGTLAVTAITSTLAGLGQMVEDRERNVLNDITLVGLKETQKNLSYVLSATIIGSVMQLILLLIMGCYFVLVDQITIPFSQLPMLLVVVFFSSFCFSLLFFAVISFIKRKNTLGKIETILGTAAGFMACVYVPLGLLPEFGQSLIKGTPAIYLAAWYRRILLAPTLADATNQLSANELALAKTSLGIEIGWGNFAAAGYEFVILIGIGLLGLLLIVLAARRRKAELS
ncbi:ABC transporter permease [Enterococcus sp. LJL90]